MKDISLVEGVIHKKCPCILEMVKLQASLLIEDGTEILVTNDIGSSADEIL